MLCKGSNVQPFITLLMTDVLTHYKKKKTLMMLHKQSLYKQVLPHTTSSEKGGANWKVACEIKLLHLVPVPSFSTCLFKEILKKLNSLLKHTFPSQQSGINS